MSQFIVSPSPHIHGQDTTRSLMRDVVIALLPAVVCSVVFYGWQQLLVLENQSSITQPTLGRRYMAYADVSGQYMYKSAYYPMLIARYMDLSST